MNNKQYEFNLQIRTKFKIFLLVKKSLNWIKKYCVDNIDYFLKPKEKIIQFINKIDDFSVN